MKKIIMILGILLLAAALVLAANGDHKTAVDEGKKLVDSGINCDKLTDGQLEVIGEYYMEQMHPGEAHEMMDQMMGGEGSDSLKQMHIQMAKRLYCNEDVGGMMGGNMMGSGGMMGMMPMMMNMMGGGMVGSNNASAMMPMMGQGMMGGNMMNWQAPQTNGMGGMMGNWGNSGYWNFINILYIILLIGLIILVYLWSIKLWRDSFHKRK